IKPFHFGELRARIRVGQRITALQQSLADRVAELEQALKKVKQLQGLLPICCYCKCIRTDDNYWHKVEEYITAHSDAQFSHGICPWCFETVVKPQLRQFRGEERLLPGRSAARAAEPLHVAAASSRALPTWPTRAIR